MIYLKLYEEFEEGKFTIGDIEQCFKQGTPIFATTVKKNTKHKPEQELKIVEIDDKTGEIGVTLDDSSDIYYVDLNDIERLGTNES